MQNPGAMRRGNARLRVAASDSSFPGATSREPGIHAHLGLWAFWPAKEPPRSLLFQPNPHHILHKFKALTAMAWPGQADMLIRGRPFRFLH